MHEQPDALYLAQALEGDFSIKAYRADAAKELRRLYEENEWLTSRLEEIKQILREE
jgi:hypothetical protein